MPTVKPNRIWVSSDVLETLSGSAAEKTPLETGGCLAGYYSEAGAELVISHALGPGPNAEHSAFRFVPDRKYDDRELAKLWTSSGRAVRYVGDWHSHPRGPSELSSVDRAFMRHALGTRKAYLKYALVCLVYGDLKRTRWWCLVKRPFGLGREFYEIPIVTY